MARYQVFIQGGVYLGTISHTLRVCEVASGSFDTGWTKRVFHIAIMQNPPGLLIIPEGKHKRSDLVDLHQVAPKLVRRIRHGNKIKAQTNTNGRGSHFRKKSPPQIKGLQGDKSVFSANLKSTDIANKGVSNG